MSEETLELPKARKPRSDKGISRKAPVASPAFLAAPEPEAPIWARVVLKNGGAVEFGCSEHAVENGFHVFLYPSERDRYRTTRREFAVSEIIEIEITAARHQVERIPPLPAQYPTPLASLPDEPQRPVAASRGPVIHSARRAPTNVIESLETSSGPIKMDALPGLSFGGHAG